MYEYSKAKNDDKRFFIVMLLSSLSKRIIIIFSLIKDNNIFVFKLLLLLFTFINYIATNAFFFTEKNIHQIYLDKGKYNLEYEIKYIIFASLISSCFLYLAKFLTMSKKLSNNNKEINLLNVKRYIFICFSMCLLIFYWIYIASLTSTYINSKIHLLFNSLITFLFCCALDFILALISTILRKISFVIGIGKIYNLSKIINFL